MLNSHGGIMKGRAYLPDTPKMYFKLLWFVMITGSFVIIEPSPYDVLFLISIIVGITFSYFGLPYYVLSALVLLVLFVISNLYSMVFVTGNITSSINYFAITFYLAITWICLVGLLKRYQKKVLDVLFAGYTTASVVASAVGILAYFRIISQYELFLLFDRVKFLFKDPNVFGPFLVPAVLFSLWRFETANKGLQRMLWLCFFALTVLGVLLSYSRAAWGNCIIALFLYIILPSTVSQKRRMVTVITLIIIMLLAMAVLIRQPYVYDMLMGRLKYQLYDNERFGTQYVSLLHVMDAPFGIGPGQIETVFGMSSHSLYVRISAEYGIVGMLSFFTFLGLTAVRAIRHQFYKRTNLMQDNIRPYLVIAVAALCGVLFNSFFIDTLHWRHFWFLLSLPWIPMNEKEGGNPDQNRSNHYTI